MVQIEKGSWFKLWVTDHLVSGWLGPDKYGNLSILSACGYVGTFNPSDSANITTTPLNKCGRCDELQQTSYS